MPPKGGNAKKESGRAKKAENEAKKQVAATVDKVLGSHYHYSRLTVNPVWPQERKEADKWAEGAKTNKTKEEREAKRREDLARKAERARLLAEEETTAPSKVKNSPKAGAKKVTKAATPAGPGAIAAGGGLGKEPEKSNGAPPEIVESYAATGIDNALDLLEVVTAKTDKASVGQQAAGIERHPEVRRCRLICHTPAHSPFAP